MDTIKERLLRWATSKFGKLAAIVLAACALLMSAIQILTEGKEYDFLSKHIWNPFEAWGGRFLAQPTGETLALFLLAVVVLLAIALVDTSQTGAVLRSLIVWFKGKKPKKLSVHERYELDCIRVMWRGDSRQACEVASSAVDSARRVLERTNRLADLLLPVVIRLRGAASALDASLDHDEPRSDVEKQFAEVRNAYAQCACWFNRCLLIEKSLLAQDTQSWFKERDFQRWAELHKSFAASIDRLMKFDGFGKFSIGLHDDLARCRFDDDL